MKLLMLYRPNSEHDTKVQEYKREFSRRTGGDLELVDLNSRDGAATASLYDVMRYPAIVATEDNGAYIQSWQEEMLPLIDEVSYYAHK